MRREPLRGPDDEDGQDSDSENVDFSIETDPCMVAVPCPGGRPVLRPTNPGLRCRLSLLALTPVYLGFIF